MSERYIEINGQPDIVGDIPDNPSPEEINQFVRDRLRSMGDFAYLFRPIENDSVYPDGEYSEIRIVIKNTNDEPEEWETPWRRVSKEGEEQELIDSSYEEFIGQSAQVGPDYQGEY